MVWLTSFSVKEGVKPEKRGFQPMRKKLDEKFGVVFSFAVVVTDTELKNCVRECTVMWRGFIVDVE